MVDTTGNVGDRSGAASATDMEQMEQAFIANMFAKMMFDVLAETQEELEEE
jgi:hypothetical protein